MDSLVVRLDHTLKGYVLTVQEFVELSAAAFVGAFRRPWYLRDTLYHMDQIGVGSLFIVIRSEEHTSELQSHHDLVCRLLLEKKKKSLPHLSTSASFDL